MSKPKVVFFDLETLPDPREVYKRLPSIGAWPGRTFKGQLHTVMSFGFKIQGEKKAHCVNGWELNDDWRTNDTQLLSFAYDILYDADEWVTHNGKKFDHKVLTTKGSKCGIPPLPKIHHVDTMAIAKKHFSFYSNSLAEIAKYFGVSKKIHWNDKWETWERFAFKEDTEQDRILMDKYCKQDVNTMSEIYEYMRPYFGNQSVNRNLFLDSKKPVCHECGSKKFYRNGHRNIGNLTYKRLQCQDCGTWGKLSMNEKNVSPL